MTQIAKAMRMRVIAWSSNLTPDRASANGAGGVSFEKIFTDSDIVSLHAPLSPDNKGMVGKKELGMKCHHALLVNKARAALIQEDSL
jgi:phosphoglycerate dehydrogenase-like enzyme